MAGNIKRNIAFFSNENYYRPVLNEKCPCPHSIRHLIFGPALRSTFRGYGLPPTDAHLALLAEGSSMHKLRKIRESIKRMNAPLSLSLSIWLATSIHGRGAEHTCKHCERMEGPTDRPREGGGRRERITCLAGTAGMLISDEEPRGRHDATCGTGRESRDAKLAR